MVEMGREVSRMLCCAVGIGIVLAVGGAVRRPLRWLGFTRPAANAPFAPPARRPAPLSSRDEVLS